MKRTVRTINTKAVIGALGAVFCAAAMLVSCNDVGSDKAERIALDHAGVTAQTVRSVVSDTDFEDGKKVYEVKFYNDGYEYEYHIDAESNEIISVEKEAARIGSDGKTELSYIGEETAKEAAVKHAGLLLSDAVFERTELDRDDGKVVYEVDFRVGDYEYDYEVDAYTAEVVKAEKEYDPVKKPAKPEATPETPVTPENPAPEAPVNPDDTTPAAPELIGADKAKEVSLAHAGADAADAVFERTELDRDDGKVVYEVDFRVGDYEYDYEIDAYTAEVVKAEKEYDPVKKPAKPEATPETPVTPEDTAPEAPVTPENPAPEAPVTPNDTTPAAPEFIGADKAKEIALAHAGVSADKVRFDDIELDKEKGKTVYEIDFEVGSYEYEYEIDAYSGEVVKFDKEYDD